MKRETKLEECNGYSCEVTVATYGLDEEQHDLAVKAVKGNLRAVGGYEIEEVDNETIEIWQDDAEDEEYKEFLALADDCYEVLAFNSVLGDFSQTLGEIIVY